MHRRILFFSLAVLFGIQSQMAQNRNFDAALSVGLPVGDSRIVIKTNYVAELAYVFKIADRVAVGPKVGYSYMTGEEVSFIDTFDDAPDQNYILASVTGWVKLINDFSVGADIGYGFEVNSNNTQPQVFGLPTENTSGFYYSPRINYHFTKRVALNVAYRSIVLESLSWDSVTAGLVFSLF